MTGDETEEIKRTRGLEFDDGSQRTAIRLDFFAPDIVMALHAIARALDRIADTQDRELEHAKTTTDTGRKAVP